MITTRDHIKGTMLIAMSEHHSGNADEARRIVDAQLAALSGDFDMSIQSRDALLEVMARAMLADELAVRPTLTFDPAWEQESDIWLSNATAALTALEAAGVRLVPVEASREMLLKAGASPDGVSPRGGTDYLGKMLPKYYAAMLAASPYAPGSEG